ncbi:MAG: nitrous oxide reductase family maturation protein NosD [Planctomycetes bacterium]|nr:nitrous oxide reductase family maturation protein NosD [Planctomycetota bacterium]
MIDATHETALRVSPPKSRVWVLHPAVRIGFAALVVALFAASYTQPLWVTRFVAPQYPYGLHLEVYLDRVTGDTGEVNILNHYVGMRPVEQMATFERSIAFALLVIVCVSAVVAAAFRRTFWQVLFILPLVLFPLGMLIDLYAWLWYAGHSLDPESALSMTVKPFTPKLIGEQRIANFDVTSTLGLGTYLQLVGSMLLAGAAAVGWRLSKGGCLLLVLFLCSPLSAQDSLQQQIDHALPGATLVVPPGTYREHLTISKPITLDGRGQVTIDGEGRGTLVTVTGAPVTLRGLTLRGSGDSFLAEDSAVKLEGADESVIEDCRLEDVLFGLYIAKSSRCAFRRLWIGGKDLPMPRRGDGVRLWYSDDTTLEQIEMVDSRDFIIWFAHRTLVRGCRVSRGRYGLHYMYCDDNRFENNRFVENQVGGTIMYSRRITMVGNRFERSRGPSAYGMLLKDADDVLAQDNEFVDNTRGLYFDNSPQSEEATCTIRRNLFALNDAGVSILPDTRRARFEENSFLDNLVGVEMIGRCDSIKNTWTGNYWSDHVPYDADGDGTSDLPYRPEGIYEDLVGAHPELALMRFSPSVAAIELAGRLFPITQSELKLEDPRPAVRPTVRPRATERDGANPGILATAAALVMLPGAASLLARRALR